MEADIAAAVGSLVQYHIAKLMVAPSQLDVEQVPMMLVLESVVRHRSKAFVFAKSQPHLLATAATSLQSGLTALAKLTGVTVTVAELVIAKSAWSIDVEVDYGTTVLLQPLIAEAMAASIGE